MAASIQHRNAEQVFYEEWMTALGYKHNRAPFRRLSESVPIADLHQLCGINTQHAYALLLGVSGLMPGRIEPVMDEETRMFLRGCWDYWWKQKSRWEDAVLPGGSWRTAGLRPQNHPARRLAAAAALVCSPFMEKLMAIPRDPASWFKDASKLVTHLASFGYWDRRLGFRAKPSPRPTALIGDGRTAALLSNVFLPFLSAQGFDIEPLLAGLPGEDDNLIIRQTASRLFGRDHNPALHASGLCQQGLLQIFSDFCLQNRADCSACPLA